MKEERGTVVFVLFKNQNLPKNSNFCQKESQLQNISPRLQDILKRILKCKYAKSRDYKAISPNG